MREILFRGKRVPDGEWVEGFYFREAGSFIKELPSAVTTPTHLVYPEAIGQYTGLTDKNGIKIFEGDIVCFHGELYSEIFSIVFADGCFRLGTKNGYSYTLHNLHSALEVIGNIHDNPELLKGGEG